MKNLTKFVAAGALAVGVASFAGGTSQAAGLSQQEYQDLASSLEYGIHTAAVQTTDQAHKGLSQQEYNDLASSLDYGIHTAKAQTGDQAQSTPNKVLSQQEYQDLATQYS